MTAYEFKPNDQKASQYQRTLEGCHYMYTVCVDCHYMYMVCVSLPQENSSNQDKTLPKSNKPITETYTAHTGSQYMFCDVEPRAKIYFIHSG